MILLFAGTTLAQEHNPGSVQPDTIQKSSENTFRKQHSSRTDHSPVGINISLWKNISTQRTDTVGSTCFNLGVFSSMNRLNGLGMNILGSVTGRNVNGMQMAGLSNMVGGKHARHADSGNYQHQWQQPYRSIRLGTGRYHRKSCARRHHFRSGKHQWGLIIAVPP